LWVVVVCGCVFLFCFGGFVWLCFGFCASSFAGKLVCFFLFVFGFGCLVGGCFGLFLVLENLIWKMFWVWLTFLCCFFYFCFFLIVFFVNFILSV